MIRAHEYNEPNYKTQIFWHYRIIKPDGYTFEDTISDRLVKIFYPECKVIKIGDPHKTGYYNH